MPPKQAKPGGKGSGDSEQAAADRLKRAEAEMTSLRRLLETRSHEALLAKQQERAWRAKCSTLEQAMEKQRKDIADISSSMEQQSQGMQDKTRGLIRALEKEVAGLKTKLQQEVANVANITARHDESQEAAEQEIKRLREANDRMRLEFADMLKTAVEQVQSRIKLKYEDV